MSFIRLTEQSATPPQPALEGIIKTVRVFAEDSPSSPGTTIPRAIDSSGNVSDFKGDTGNTGATGATGPQGPQGPAGSAAKQSVVNINDPSSELASIGGATGDLIIVYQDADPTQATKYVFDSTVTVANNIPFIVAGTSGKWIACGGKYTNGDHNVQNNIILGGTVDGRDITADGTKLDGIEVSATADQSDVEIKTAYENNVNTNAFTDVEQTKLTGIETGATADQTAGEIKTAYESNANTNEFSDAEETKLAGIEALAEVNDAFGGAPPNVAAASAAGIAADKSRSDHTHGHGNQAGGALHADATISVSGFMSGADKTKLDGLASADPLVQTIIEEEFPPNNSDTDEIATHNWRKTSAGTGNQGLMIDGEGNHPGIYRMGSGTASGARSMIYLGEPGNDLLSIGNGIIDYDAIIRGTGTIGNFERFLIGLGQRDTTNAEWTEGIYFRILAGGTNWEIVSANAGVRSAVDTGIAYVTGNWIRLGFTINAAGTSIQARINGTNAGIPITTNIPSVAISPIFMAGALAAGGGTNSTLDADHMKLVMNYSGARND